MSDVAQITEADMLEAVQNRLRDKIEEYNETNCWFDDDPLPTRDDPGHFLFACSVSPVDGNFNQEDQLGGSRCMLQESSGFIITPMRRYEVDYPQTADEVMVAAPDDAIIKKWKPAILNALLIDRSSAGVVTAWEPTTAAGLLMLTDSIKAVTSGRPKRHQEWPILYCTMVFSCGFRWKI